MPELPEVQTVVSGIEPWLINKKIEDVEVFHTRLSHPIQTDLKSTLQGLVIKQVIRRAKYIVLRSNVDVVIHLGMSGKLLVKEKEYEIRKHDHIVLRLEDKSLVFNDPRRFGHFFWTPNYQERLAHLGPEPLSESFSGEYLYLSTKRSSRTIKQKIMDQKIVVGVGNIYANEALFDAGILPHRRDLSKAECEKLADCIKTILTGAIQSGGTTLKDYRTSDDQLGYFQQQLKVYGKKACQCGKELVCEKIEGRATYYCLCCQH